MQSKKKLLEKQLKKTIWEAESGIIILYRIPEKKTESVSDRKQNNMIFVKDLLDCVFDMELENSNIEKFYRLGHWEEDKARPLLIAFKNCEKKITLWLTSATSSNKLINSGELAFRMIFPHRRGTKSKNGR